MGGSVTGSIYDIQKFSVHDGPGVRTTVFLKGCPLKCLWCHSPESQDYGPQLSQMEVHCIGLKDCGLCVTACRSGAIAAGQRGKTPGGVEIEYPAIDRARCTNCMNCAEGCPTKSLYNVQRSLTAEGCMRILRQDRAFYEKSGGGVTISGGEPVTQIEFCTALAEGCTREGFHVAVDTTGYADFERYERLLPYVDLFLYDLKHMDTARSEKLTGVGNGLILENAVKLAEAGARLQIRIPVIPKLNDSEENMEAAARFCEGIKNAIDLVQLLPYHKLGAVKYARLGREYKLKNVEAPGAERMEAELERFKGRGLPAQIH